MFELEPGASSADVVLAIFGHELKMFRYGDGWRAFAGVPLAMAPDLYPTSLHLGDGASFICGETRVAPREYAYEELHVSRGFTGKKRPPSPLADGLATSVPAPLDRPPTATTLFLWPKSGPVNAVFGDFRLFNRRIAGRHLGLDIGGRIGDRVFATQAGIVRYSGHQKSGGEAIMVDHGGGVQSYYLHLSKRLARWGARVRQGEVIGFVGRTGRVTGPHLHFAVSVHGRYVDPIAVLSHPMFADGDGAPCQMQSQAAVAPPREALGSP
jgi:hypothetical protein